MSSSGILAVAILAMGAVLAACAGILAPGARAQTTTLYSFMGGADGSSPNGGVVYHKGILYGTTAEGGTFNGKCLAGPNDIGCGVLFSVNATTGAETVVHSFQGGADGNFPLATPIYQGGTLYGTTELGGTTGCNGEGCGTVYAIKPATGANTVLYTFQGGTDGALPRAGLTYQGGFLYGTTSAGGSAACAGGCGTVFAINATTGAETVLYRLQGGNDGATSYSDLLYQGGLLYGTSEGGGGACDCGTVFAVNATTGAETVLYRFQDGNDGEDPDSTLIYANGLLYGSTAYGGLKKCDGSSCGTVFSVDPISGAETILYKFRGRTRGQHPESLSYHNGFLYSSAYYGYNISNLFKMATTHAKLKPFCNFDLAAPLGSSGTLIYQSGLWYGSTADGGSGRACAGGCGTVFACSP